MNSKSITITTRISRGLFLARTVQSSSHCLVSQNPIFHSHPGTVLLAGCQGDPEPCLGPDTSVLGSDALQLTAVPQIASSSHRG